MSNRLRASMRAGNKGRSLRPRAQLRNSAVPPESDFATADERDKSVARAIAVEPAPSGAQRAVAAGPSPVSPDIEEEVPGDEADDVLSAKGTPAELLASGEAFIGSDEDEDELEPPLAKIHAPVAAKLVEAPVAMKPIEAPVAAKPVEAPVAMKPVEAAVLAEKVEVTKKSEPLPQARKVELAPAPQVIAPVVAKKAEEPKKSDAPAQAKKSDAPPSARQVEPVKAVVPAAQLDVNATTLRAERLTAAEPESRSGNKKKGGKAEPPPAEARRPAEDDVDSSSISAEFFRREVDSLPPLEAHGDHTTHDDHEDAGLELHLLSPATIARRARLRRLVAGVVAFAGVITLAVVGKTLAASKQPASSALAKTSVTEMAKVEGKAAPAPAEVKPAEVKPAEVKAAEVKPAVEAPKASAEVAKAEPDPKATAEEPKKVDEPKKAEPSGGDAKALTKEAESFLNRGNRKDAMAKAREAIDADPSEAMPYLLLGSALQDSGKWKDGIEAYSECVRHATKGPVNECRQMGGHK